MGQFSSKYRENLWLHWFSFTPCDWSGKLAPPFRKIRWGKRAEGLALSNLISHWLLVVLSFALISRFYYFHSGGGGGGGSSGTNHPHPSLVSLRLSSLSEMIARQRSLLSNNMLVRQQGLLKVWRGFTLFLNSWIRDMHRNAPKSERY